MNQILVTEKLYVTPELKKKKKMYKINFILSLIIIVLIVSIYFYIDYKRNKSAQVSEQILADINQTQEEVEKTKKKAQSEVLTVVLNNAQEDLKVESLESTDNYETLRDKKQTTEDGYSYYTIAKIYYHGNRCRNYCRCDRCLVWKSADRNLRVQDHTLSIFTAIPANCWAGDHSNVLRIQQTKSKRNETRLRSWPAKNRCHPITTNSISNDRNMVNASIRRKCWQRRSCSSDRSNPVSCTRKKIKLPREWKNNVSHRYGSRIWRVISDTIKCNILCNRGNRNRENGL